jgi:type IV pilus assembly protein PilZ
MQANAIKSAVEDRPEDVMATQALKSQPNVRVDYIYIEDFLVDYTSNHTIGGMFIKTDRPMAVGTRFQLYFQLPGGRAPIEAMARVRWTLPCDVAAPMTPGMGIRFEALSVADRGFVEGLIDIWR